MILIARFYNKTRTTFAESQEEEGLIYQKDFTLSELISKSKNENNAKGCASKSDEQCIPQDAEHSNIQKSFNLQKEDWEWISTNIKTDIISENHKISIQQTLAG